MTTPVGSGCGASTAIRCDGFEDQTGPAPSGHWSTVTPNCAGAGTAAISTTTAHTGTRSLQINGADDFRRVGDGALRAEVNTAVAGLDDHELFSQRIRNFLHPFLFIGVFH